VFLVEKLDFSWDEVHEIAEQLEHIKSEKLINKLDDFRNPTEDPHGDPIPNAGQILKLISNYFRNWPRIKRDLCGSERYFIRVLEIPRQTRNRFGHYNRVVSKESFDLSVKIKVDDRFDFK
jgi:DtxR family Mn-dependent transcriptional regulator